MFNNFNKPIIQWSLGILIMEMILSIEIKSEQFLVSTMSKYRTKLIKENEEGRLQLYNDLIRKVVSKLHDSNSILGYRC